MAILSGLTISGGGVTIVGGMPPTDPYFMYNTLLLPGNGTNGAQNNTFTDGSTNSLAITRNGTTIQGTFSPYGGNWSNYFDGSGDYLTTPSSLAMALGSTFTVECWIYVLAWNVSSPTILDVRDSNIVGAIYLENNGTARMQTTGTGTIASQTGITLNTWIHVAFVSDATSSRVYVNGSNTGATNQGQALFPTTAKVGFIGADFSGGFGFNGYISNMRVVKGTALYIANFTPSTTPLTAIANTSLLTCQSNRFIDNSGNSLTVTANGSPTIQRFSPFSPTAAYSTSTIGGSGYFDGTGDYLVTAADSALALATNAADFTMECWVYNNGGAGSQYGRGISIYYPSGGYATNRLMFRLVAGGDRINLYLLAGGSAEFGGPGVDGTATVTIGAWTHVALVRNAGVFYAYVNGVLDITVSSSSAASSIPFTTYNIIEVGRTQDGSSPDWFGNISNYRFVKGTAVYTSNFVPPSQPVTAITNTALLLNMTNAGIIDNAMMNNLDTVGNAQISTTQSQFGGSSMYFDGTGDYLLIPTTVALAFPGDYTLECWVYLNSVSGNQGVYSSIDNSGDSNQGIAISFSNTSFLATSYISGGDAITHQTAVTTGQWYHLAMVRSGSTTKSYLNGVQSTGTTTSTYSLTQSGSTIGSAYPGTNPLNGYINDLRITKGYARYTATFTPPTTAFPIN